VPRLRTWRDVSEDEARLLAAAMHRPGIELAERVGWFETPFDYLKTVSGGFHAGRRFLLNQILAGDEEAIAVRDDIAIVRRHWRLREPLRGQGDLEREYGLKHDREIEAFERAYYPWFNSAEREPWLVSKPDPRADAILDDYICRQMAEYGFTVKTRKAKETYWRCHSSLLSRRITIEFDKGDYLPSTHVTGRMLLNDFDYSVALGDPFFFSGCAFDTSVAD
jgi:hypothetical protein